MTSKRRLLGLLAAVAALCLTAGGARSQQPNRGDLTEEFHQTYQLAPGGRVRLENINGDVRVRAWDQNAVKVDAVKYAFTQERLREAEILVNADAQGVRVRTRYPYESMSFHSDGPRARNNPATVEYVLTVPRGARIDRIDLINGGLDIEGLTGEVAASSINGRLAARALSGTVKLSTVNGPLEVAFDRLGPNLVDLNSVNGPLTLTLPSDASAEVRASTVHGGISNDVGLPVKHGKYVGHNLAGRFGAGATRVRLDNVNGPIRLRRAQDGRTASPVVNLLLETAAGGGDGDWDDVNEEVEREVREALKEAERERREAVREAQREREQERQRERVQTDRERLEGQREREQQRLEQQRERERERAEQQRQRQEQMQEAQREREEALREAAEERRRLQEEARAITRDAARVSRDVAREIGRGVRVDVDGDDNRQIERVSNTFPAAGSPRVRVSNFDGPVTVIAWDKPEVMYTAVKRAHDQREMQGIKINADVSNSTRTGQGAASAGGSSEIVISASFDKAHAHQIETRGERIVSIGSDASVEFELYVPRSSVLTLNTADGRLRVDGVQGDVEMHTGDGGIDLSNGRGRLRAQTGDGRIRIVDFNGEVTAQTGDGRIMLEGDFSQLNARTGDGSISLSVPDGTNAFIDTDAETVNSDGMAVAEDAAGAGARGGLRRWKVGGGGRVYTLRTGDGQIILRRR